jgi:hypothetical protein
MAGGFTWSHGVVQAGTSVTITVTGSPCRPVKVTLTVDGQTVGTSEITDVPGSTQINVPAGAGGKPYSIKISCNGNGDASTGQVQ